MVVRYILRSVVNRIPGSSYLPNVVTSVLSEEEGNRILEEEDEDLYNDDYSDNSSVLPVSPKERIHSRIMNNRINELGVVDEVDEIEYELSQLRQQEEQGQEVKDDISGDDIGTNYLNYVDTCDTIPAHNHFGINKLNHNPLVVNNNKSRKISNNRYLQPKQTKLLQPLTAIGAEASSTLVDSGASSTVSDNKSNANNNNSTNQQSIEERNLRVKRYLNEQNSKFDELIINNLDIVFKEYGNDINHSDELESMSSPIQIDDVDVQSRQQEHQYSLIHYIFLNATNKFLSNVPFGSLLMKKKPPIKKDILKTNNISPSKYKTNNNPSPSIEDSSYTYASGSLRQPEPSTPIQRPATNFEVGEESHTERNEQSERITKSNSQLVDGNRPDMELFLDTLDPSTRLSLYKFLREEFSDNTNAIDISYNENDLFLDKLQTFLLISVKLFITSLKLAVPVSQYIYYKFKNDQIFLLNHHNLIKLFNRVLKLMNYVDYKLNSNEELIEKIYNQEYMDKNLKIRTRIENDEEKFDELYQELSINFSKFMSDQIVDNIINNESLQVFTDDKNLDSVFRKSLMEYLMAKYVNEPVKRAQSRQQQRRIYQKDPNFAKYFSPHKDVSLDFNDGRNDWTNPQGSSSRVSPQNESSPSPESLNTSFKTPLSNSSSTTSSSDNLQDMSVFGIAQKFADRLA
ncbi:uncharacterized protein RJT21DRAFT_125702 [Scheffersomyces amazonensis]|uniref:uncharacterized protein n=1 Tax=Scheffersomyces amazonensis TaxID=1078765 RepID=UPI00315CC0B1